MIDLITLSDTGARVASRLAAGLPDCRLHFHESLEDTSDAEPFERTASLVKELFPVTEGIIFIGPCGVIVRAVAPLLQSKLSDPPVLVLDVLARYSVSLLSGHEGGANQLAMTVSNILGSEPVITTTSDAARTIIVGIGCRRGASSQVIIEAVNHALTKANIALDEVRLLASADIKSDEPGLRQAANELRIPLRLIASEEIRACIKEFSPTSLAREKVNLPAVAEPTALLAGRRTALILPKTIHNGVTVAIAKENSL